MTQFNENFQNLIENFFRSIGIIDQNGDLQESVTIEKLTAGEHALTEEKVKQCIATASENKVKGVAYELAVCCYEIFMIDNC